MRNIADSNAVEKVEKKKKTSTIFLNICIFTFIKIQDFSFWLEHFKEI